MPITSDNTTRTFPKIRTGWDMISIAMATYNGERYIKEQIDSILTGDDTGEPLEIVVSDDCSQDKTLSILKEYALKDSRIRVYENPHNLGFLHNFEHAISLCRGEYIAFSDQDDIWCPCHLRVLKKTMDATNALAVGGSYVFMSDKGELYTDERAAPRPRVPDTYLYPNERVSPQELLARILYNSGIFHGASMMVRRKLVNMALPFPEGIQFHDLWLSLMAIALGRATITGEIVTHYRVHSATVTRHGDAPIVEHRSILQKLANISWETVKFINPYGIEAIATALLKMLESPPTECALDKATLKEVVRLLEFTTTFAKGYKSRITRWQCLAYYWGHIAPVIYHDEDLLHKLRSLMAYLIL